MVNKDAAEQRVLISPSFTKMTAAYPRFARVIALSCVTTTSLCAAVPDAPGDPTAPADATGVVKRLLKKGKVVPTSDRGDHRGKASRTPAHAAHVRDEELEKHLRNNVRATSDPLSMPYNNLVHDPKTGKVRFAYSKSKQAGGGENEESGKSKSTTSNKPNNASFLQKNKDKQSPPSLLDAGSTGQDSQQSGLFPIKLNFDVEQLPIVVSMVYDADDRALRLDSGGAAGVEGGPIAAASFTDSIEYLGWAHLNVTLGDDSLSVDDDVKMYSAGYAEGILTSVRISEFFANHHKLLIQNEKSNHALMNIKNVVAAEVAGVKENSVFEEHVMPEEPNDPYWRQIRFMLFQLWGMLDGYNYMANHYVIHKLTMLDLLILNSFAELPQMMNAFSPRAVADRTEAITASQLVFLQEEGLKRSFAAHTQSSNMEGNEATGDPLDDWHWERRLAEDAHCTAYVRLTDTDLMLGHATWGDYASMLRIYKFYDFSLSSGNTIAKVISMSSYPGLISSGDDYYLTDSGLVIADTSIEILNTGLLDKVVPDPLVPGFLHLMAVTRLSRSGAEWTSRFQTMNSGTRAAQWLVLDYNNYMPGKALQAGTFWVLEMVPGAAEARDLSAQLNDNKFFGSVNRPTFAAIREATGFTAAEESHGALYSVNDNPRMKILSAAEPTSLLDMRGLMTSNGWGTWPGPTSPGHAIAARMDLARQAPIPNGAIDAKIVNFCLSRLLSVQAKSGPTDNAQPPFRWEKKDGSERFPGTFHYGLPNVWTFPWVQVSGTGVDQRLTDIETCSAHAIV
ncbi:unnamed protein product [Amoebophrya sp. A25]|nr:unnamed protein product [Amoebophrya sp. A25]|eukprot:GSA25T00013804001.1